MPAKKIEPPQIYRIKVTLQDTHPPIWRRLLVPSSLTLAQLHDVLQAAMGWTDSHLHRFYIGRRRYGVLDPDERLFDELGYIDENRVRLFEVLRGAGAKALYTYDFGDSWEHRIAVEKVLLLEAGFAGPVCTGGKLNCPPEDCGGIGGFYDFLDAIENPAHERHEELLEWIGGSYDPEWFSLDEVNLRMPKIRPARKAASAV
jgi:hypothetical protein